MSTLSEQLAAEWFAVDPDAVNICSKCLTEYRIAGPIGPVVWRPSVVCPNCWYTPSDDLCLSALQGLKARRQEIAEKAAASALAGEMTEAARVAGSEPSVVRIQCRCSDCGAASEAAPLKAGQDEICPECGRKLTAADRLASELIAFNPDATTRCLRCKTPFSVIRSGMTCPQCGDVTSEEACEAALKHRSERMGDWRRIRHLGGLLSEDPARRKASHFTCPFCRGELPSSLADRNFARIACPSCNRGDVYVYNAEAFQSPRDCERVLEFRLEKSKKAKGKARQRELAEAAKEIGTGARADRGQANGGHVYALLNSTMAGLVKIGKTEREPEERAKELSCGTGIPTPFVVAYAEWFKDCSAAEDYVHSLMEQKGFRVSQNREFFCAPVKAAIQAIMKAKERDDRSDGSPPATGAVG